MDDPNHLYECLLDYCSQSLIIKSVTMGHVWTVCQSEKEEKVRSGLSMTPIRNSRTLAWPGTLVGQSLKDIASWILEWDQYQSTIGMAAINCSINHSLTRPQGILLDQQTSTANLTVFEYFLPLIQDQKVVVIGHYPGIEHYVNQYGWHILERQQQAGDYPDPAAEFLIPDADWVFISASTIPNKTFPRLAQLSRSAQTVLMGPTVPWVPELHDFGIDYLAGVEVTDDKALIQTAAEGGGVRIFETAVRYKVFPLAKENSMQWLKQSISDSYKIKQSLSTAMSQWYDEGQTRRYPQYEELNDINHQLSRMDSAYKTLWDQQQNK